MASTQDPVAYLRATLSLLVAVGYIVGLVVGSRRIWLPPVVHWSGITFFVTGAVKNVALAFDTYESQWFLINDFAQATAIVVFVASMTHLMTAMSRTRRQREANPTEVE